MLKNGPAILAPETVSIKVNRDPARFAEVIKSLGYDNNFLTLYEFVDNAFAAGASKIWIIFDKTKSGGLRIIIRDNGTGIPEDRWAKIGEYGALPEEKEKACAEELLNKNNIGAKAAAGALARNAVWVTIVDGESVSLYPKPGEVKIKRKIVSPDELGEIEEIGQHGVSVILTDLDMTPEEWSALRLKTIELLGMYSHRLLVNPKTNKKVANIWVCAEDEEDKKIAIEPFNPLCIEYVPKHASEEHEPVVLMAEQECELDITNNRAIRARVAITHIPPKRLLKALQKDDLIKKYYPAHLKDGQGIFIYRNNRLIAVLPTSNLRGDGGHLHSLRVAVYLSSKDAEFLFDKDVKKNKFDALQSFFAALYEFCHEAINSSKKRRERSMARLEELGLQKIRPVAVDVLKEAVKKVILDTSGKDKAIASALEGFEGKLFEEVQKIRKMKVEEKSKAARNKKEKN